MNRELHDLRGTAPRRPPFNVFSVFRGQTRSPDLPGPAAHSSQRPRQKNNPDRLCIFHTQHLTLDSPHRIMLPSIGGASKSTRKGHHTRAICAVGGGSGNLYASAAGAAGFIAARLLRHFLHAQTVI